MSPSSNVPVPAMATASSSSSPPPGSSTSTILTQSSFIPKDQPETPPPSLPQSSTLTGSNPNDPIPLLVATLFDQKLSMFASNLQPFNIDHLQYHFTPPNTQIYQTPTSMSFDPVTFLAKQQQHRLI